MNKQFQILLMAAVLLVSNTTLANDLSACERFLKAIFGDSAKLSTVATPAPPPVPTPALAPAPAPKVIPKPTTPVDPNVLSAEVYNEFVKNAETFGLSDSELTPATSQRCFGTCQLHAEAKALSYSYGAQHNIKFDLGTEWLHLGVLIDEASLARPMQRRLNANSWQNTNISFSLLRRNGRELGLVLRSDDPTRAEVEETYTELSNTLTKYSEFDVNGETVGEQLKKVLESQGEDAMNKLVQEKFKAQDVAYTELKYEQSKATAKWRMQSLDKFWFGDKHINAHDFFEHLTSSFTWRKVLIRSYQYLSKLIYHTNGIFQTTAQTLA